MNHRAYPFASLRKVSRRDVSRSQQLARFRVAGDAELTRSLTALLGAVSVHPEPLASLPAAEMSSALGTHVVACLLVGADPTERGVLELSPPMGHAIINRALGGEASSSAGLLNDVELGVLTHSVSLALANSKSRYSLSGIVQSPFAMSTALESDTVWVWPYRVAVDTQQFVARMWFRSESLVPVQRQPQMRWSKVPIRVSLVAAEGRLAATECALLAVGDIVVLDVTYADLSASEGLLRVTGSKRFGMTYRRVDEGLLLVEDKSSIHSVVSEGAVMPSEEEHQPELISQRVSDAPIELSIEMASFTVPLEDLNDLHAGQVIATGRLVGEHVVLRTSTHTIATGELVDIEGELGIRLLTLSD